LFAPFFQRYFAELDAFMRHVVASQPHQPNDFGVMLRYALGWVDEHDQPYPYLTGKRIRPILLLLCNEAAGGNWHSALPAAAAVELLHNFSLLHDDIQDDSPLRHNRATVWKIWGRSHAINAGDALFTLAYSALEGLSSTDISPRVALEVWKIFNLTSLELTRGQHLDMRFEKQADVTVDDYLSMIQGKSAALIAASAQLGALTASEDKTLASHYANFGLNLGMAFQIRDDILGIWGDPRVTGKSAATDILSQKKSLPVLYGLAKSEPLAVLYQNPALNETDVADAVAILDSLDAQDYAKQIEAGFYQKAFQALERAKPQGEGAMWLKELIESLFDRPH
jgi:geranylgeranyl diphosphate synthase type I